MKGKNHYWYHDNWSGTKKTFNSLNAARRAAKKETGASVIINSTDGFVEYAKSSGYTPN